VAALGSLTAIAWHIGKWFGRKEFEYSWVPWYIFRPFVGSGLAVTFYFMLRGGLLIPTAYNVPSTSNGDDAAKVTNEVIRLASELVDSGHTALAMQILNSHKESNTPQDTTQRDSSSVVQGTQTNIKSNKNEARSNGAIPPINPYGLLAISVLAGIFSRQAIKKLEEIFDSMFRTAESPLKKGAGGGGGAGAGGN